MAPMDYESDVLTEHELEPQQGGDDSRSTGITPTSTARFGL